MGLASLILRPFAHLFGYDAATSTGRRAQPPGLLRSEDRELMPWFRRRLVSAGRNIHRNFSIAGWMIRRHLDYCSTFEFHSRTGIPDLDEQVEALINWWSQPENCDITGRYNLARQIRLAEERRTVDGDVGCLKLNDGRLQWIEGDRIQNITPDMPDGWEFPGQFVHGVQTDQFGKPIAYCVCRRALIGFVFERVVSADNLILHGFFDRFDQLRGISPFAAAINVLRDCYEGFDYALAKAKVSQLFALAFYRETDDPLGNVTPRLDEDGNPVGYDVDFSKGPVKLDLEPGDRAEFLESHTPSSEFQAFTQAMISTALKALDIPYSFYAENFTNYSGARQALLQYEQSADTKRADVQHLLDHLTAWRLGMFVQDGRLSLPAGVTVADLNWEWVARGLPWIDPLKEAQADAAAIDAGLSSRQRRCKERGEDWFEIADELAQEQEYLKAKGIELAPAKPQPQQQEEANADA